MENNVTALLVRSTKAGWTRGSVVAVDAGVHLSAITRILEETQPKALGEDVALPHKLHTGPFAGLEVKSNSAAVNAANFTRQLIDTYLITHPHLDHISGFVINTAGPAGLRPKRLAGLPSTISAFKSHIFNNVIWPNLSDENNGAGLVTYMRLVEGGSPALGEGEGRGYLEVSDGLAVKAFGVSHGHCIERHTHRGSTCSSRFGSGDINMMSPGAVPLSMPMPMPRGVSASNGTSGPTSFFRSTSLTPRMSAMSVMSNAQDRESMCVYDSSAYFIRDSDSGREVLIFGDVEADSISLTPRNMHIWQEAAPRIASGKLTGIFIECSYDDSQTDDRLFGHLCPRFIIEELQALANEVEAVRQAPVKLETTKKRKRETEEEVRRANKSVARSGGDEAPVSPKSNKPSRGSLGELEYSLDDQEDMDTPTLTPTADLNLKGLESSANASLSPAPSPRRYPLRGLKVVIIHVKDNFSDTETTRDIIQGELLEHERESQLGCEFLVSQRGDSFML